MVVTRLRRRSRAGESEVVSLPRRRIAWTLVGVGLPLLTLALHPVRGTSALATALLLYLLAVVLVSAVGGLGPGLVAAVGSFGLANFWLTTPFRTLQVAAAERLIELVVFVVVAALVSATVDLSARHRAAAERSQAAAAVQEARAQRLAEAERVRSGILAAVSHDLRTPLAGIKASVSSLRQSEVAWSAAERGELLAAIEDSTDRLSDVVANLLAMSRIQAGAVSLQVRPAGLDEIVARALLTVAGASSVAVDVAESLPPVSVDPDLLERVVANLVANAVRADPHGVEVRSTEEEGGVLLAVVDHGPGVPPDRWEEMFWPFHQLDAGPGASGSGVGLAIVRGFCDAMGIEVTPEATPGGGLTMTLHLERA